MTVDPSRPHAHLIAQGALSDPEAAAWYNRGIADARAHLLTPEQAAQQLEASASTVRRLARSGSIGFIRLRRNDVAESDSLLRFRQSHIDDYLAANESAPEVEQVKAPRRAQPMTDLQRRYPHLAPRSQVAAK
ncbi:MAG: helix-turn-helix domain-containing protein [Thermoleophilia bacterium]|nr:helix-turn-helix domain-containing protein [Thermoleophilia bacterium]